MIRKCFPEDIPLLRNENGLYTLNSYASQFENYKILTFKRKYNIVDLIFTLVSYLRGAIMKTEWHDRYNINLERTMVLKQRKYPQKAANGKISTHYTKELRTQILQL
ncbi:MAG: hypothetical protein ACMUEM_07180 [Flavobacteriales bacterium AspAUS03]